MESVMKNLDKIKLILSNKDFLENKGLSNEVGIHVFCYQPEAELVVRNYVDILKKDNKVKCNIVEYDLYEIFIQILEDKKVLKNAHSLEEKKGKEYLLTQLQKIASTKAFVEKMNSNLIKGKDVIFLTGVGKVYPFMRSHNLLENMQPFFSEVPIVLFYPGDFNGHKLKLFNEFHDGNYYRAFNII